MIITAVNSLVCATGLILGLYTLIKHLNAFNDGKTPVVDAWLVAVGSLAWSVALFANATVMIELKSLESEQIGLSHAEMMTNFLMLVYWVGAILQIQKHCLKLKLRKRKLERAK